MGIDNIGAILKDLIKERGFTQEEFADITGIGLSSLKKYMSGKVYYSVDTLKIIAERLQCSYDYLLGKSLTPNREIQDIKEATRLEDGALERLSRYAKSYDKDHDSKRYIETLSTLIQSNFLVERIVDFFYIDSDEEFVTENYEFLPQKSIFVGEEHLTPPDIEAAYLLGIMKALIQSKVNIGKNIPSVLRNYRI